MLQTGRLFVFAQEACRALFALFEAVVQGGHFHSQEGGACLDHLSDGLPCGVDGAFADAAAGGCLGDYLTLGQFALQVGLHHIRPSLFCLVERYVALNCLHFDTHNRSVFKRIVHQVIDAKILPLSPSCNSCSGCRRGLFRILTIGAAGVPLPVRRPCPVSFSYRADSRPLRQGGICFFAGNKVTK